MSNITVCKGNFTDLKTSDFDPMSRKTIRMMSEVPALLNLAFDHESDNNKDNEGDEFRMVVFFLFFILH